MIFRVPEGGLDAGTIGYQTSSLSYTFSHWSGSSKFRLYKYSSTLMYKPIGPTILVEWEE